jgi:uncharacterized protein with PIN domain
VTQAEPRDTQPSSPEPDDRSDKGDKKERVLHTRVPAVLERELKRFADTLRVPVSNLVRTILEDAVKVADAAGTGLEERLKSAATVIEQEREKLKRKVSPDPLASVFAFQDVTLAQPARCAQCAAELPRGTRAHFGLPAEAEGRTSNVVVCDQCLPRG